jgi:predicted dinucleotide-binding enzyme
MKITVIGRGNVGGGLGERWRAAGHEVAELGRDGGDASQADVVLVAVPAEALGAALASVSGLEGKVAIDATNAIRVGRGDFDSLAHQVKSVTGGPTAKAFNTIFARMFAQIDEQRARPSCVFCADDDAREPTRQLIADAGLDPVDVGGLEHARALEDFLLGVIFPVAQERGGPFFYRMAGPGEL